MITPNIAPRDYQWRLEPEATYSDLGGTVDHEGFAYLRVLYGNEYLEEDGDEHGFQILVAWRHTPLATTPVTDTRAWFRSPWGDWDLTPIAAWEETPTFRIEVDQLRLRVRRSCEWEIAFEELRVYANMAGSEELVLTIGPTTDSGEGFDHRLNYTRIDKGASIQGLSLPLPGECFPTLCGSDSGQDPVSLGTYVTIKDAGWRWWSDDLADWDTDVVRMIGVDWTDIECDCPYPPPPAITTVNSWEIGIGTSQAELDTDIEFVGKYYCECLGSADKEHDVWRVKDRWPFLSAHVNAVASDIAPMRMHRKSWEQVCAYDEYDGTDDDLEEYAYCEYGRSVEFWECQRQCDVITNPNPPCLDPPGGPEPLHLIDAPAQGTGKSLLARVSPCPNPYPIVEYSCYYKLVVSVTWPEEEPCATGGSLAYHVARGWRHARADIHDDGVLVLGFAPNDPVDWTDYETDLHVDSVAIHHEQRAKTNRLFLIYCVGGGLLLTSTDDQGATFTMPTALGDGDFGTLCFAGNGLLYAFRLHEGTVYGRLFDGNLNQVGDEWETSLTGLDDYPIQAQASVDSDKSLRIGILYRIGDALSFAVSDDGKAFV